MMIQENILIRNKKHTVTTLIDKGGMIIWGFSRIRTEKKTSSSHW